MILPRTTVINHGAGVISLGTKAMSRKTSVETIILVAIGAELICFRHIIITSKLVWRDVSKPVFMYDWFQTSCFGIVPVAEVCVRHLLP